jgi:hypothetical protein
MLLTELVDVHSGNHKKHLKSVRNLQNYQNLLFQLVCRALLIAVLRDFHYSVIIIDVMLFVQRPVPRPKTSSHVMNACRKAEINTQLIP